MNSPLSAQTQASITSFLANVTRSARLAPRYAREALRSELKSHIESLVDEYQSLGMSELQALESAFSKMGTARTIGRSYSIEWIRKNWRHMFWPAFFGSFLIYNVVVRMMSEIVHLLHFPDRVSWPSVSFFLFCVAWTLLSFLTGWITGLCFPIQGIRAVRWMLLTYYFLILPVFQLVTNHGIMRHPFWHHPLSFLLVLLYCFGSGAMNILITLFPAFLGAKTAVEGFFGNKRAPSTLRYLRQ